MATGIQESKIFCINFLTKLWIKLDGMWCVVSLMSLILILSCVTNIVAREPSLCNFSQTKIYVGLHWDIYQPISFIRDMMIETTELFILIPVWMTLAFIQDHRFMSNEKMLCCFGLLKLMLNWLCTIKIHGRENYLLDYMKYTFSIDLCQDTGESVSFKLGVMLNMTKHCNMILVEWPWPSLEVTGFWEN